jgi:hypothetical protein
LAPFLPASFFDFFSAFQLVAIFDFFTLSAITHYFQVHAQRGHSSAESDKKDPSGGVHGRSLDTHNIPGVWSLGAKKRSVFVTLNRAII